MPLIFYGPASPDRRDDIKSPRISHDWYVIDILILDESQESVSTNLEIVLQTCSDAGLIVNKKKSQLNSSQRVTYLGQKINLKIRMRGLQHPKLSRGLEITKVYKRRSRSTPANIAGMAGTFLPLQKSNVALHGLQNAPGEKLPGCYMVESTRGPTPHIPRNCFGCLMKHWRP